jgi:hypothetical protein
MQLPWLHTWPVPHDVPSGALAVKEHVDAPVEQLVVPVWQGPLFGLHAVPAVHATHDPLLQTWLVPHVMPFAELPPLMQTDVPDAHDVLPARQTLPPGLHGAFAVHETQLPPLHTWLVPHAVPSATFAALPHVAVPVAHDVDPVWQTLPPGLQMAPAVQAPHWPLLQT